MKKGKVLLTVFIGIFLVAFVSISGYFLGSKTSNTPNIPIFKRIQSPKLIGLEYRGLFQNIPKLFVVQSGSMEPAIPTASLVITTRKNTYQAGDIITFYRKSDKKRPITHRIIAKLYPEGIDAEPTYLTAGDANDDIDNWRIKNADIVGKIAYSVPYVGYLVDFAKKPYGFILFVIVPATIIIYEELRFVFVELKKFIRRLFKRDISRNFKKEGVRLPKAAVLLPLFGALIVIGGITLSIYFDSEESLDNIFAAADNFGLTPTPSLTVTPSPSISPSPSPQPGNIVINEVYYFVHNDHKVTNSEADSEWAELYNNTNLPISLQGWSVSDNTSCDNIPGNPIIPANGFAILAVVSEIDFRAVWDPISPIPVGTVFIQSPTAIGNGLANNDELMLRSGTCPSGGIIVDHISWGSNTDGLNPSIPMTTRGNSSERDPDGTDTDTNSDFTERDPPTPGS